MNSSENSCNISSLDRPSLFTDESISAPNSSTATPLAADTDTTDAKSKLKLLRVRNIGRVIIGYLNINSVRNKFDALKEIALQSLDVLMIAETKLDATFPTGQFAIEGFATPFRLDRNANGGGILVYVRSDIPSRQVKSYKFSDGIECISFEINLRKKKWVLFSVYRPPTQSQDYLFENLGRALDHYSDNYENFMFIGDFNMTETEEQMKNFLDLYSLKNLMQEPTCYKFSVFFQILKLLWFCYCFIAISILALPFTLTIQFLVHCVTTQSGFLPLFARVHHIAKTVLYTTIELFKRIPLGVIGLVRYKHATVRQFLFLYAYCYIGCMTSYILHTQWMVFRTVLLSGDVETNPGPETLDFCTWNLNSITAYDFLRVSLMEAYSSVYNYDLIGIVGTHLDSTVDEEKLSLNGYTFIKTIILKT